MSFSSTLHVPNSVLLVEPTTIAVLPANQMREAHESAFTVGGSAKHYATQTSLLDGINGTVASSYTHRERPTLDRPFVAYHRDFLHILGKEPKLNVAIKDEDGRAMYHEAGVWIEETQQVFVTSNLLRDEVIVHQKSGLKSGLVAMSMLKLESQNAQVTRLPPTASLPTANGACIFQGQLLVCDQGYGDLQPSQLVLVNPLPPHAVTPILNNFHGRPFNSLNDVAVLSTPGTSPPQDTVWFTDPTYGYEQGFKPEPRLPPQVYCFDPYSGNVRAVADGFVKPNGISFNREATRCYITDTGVIRGCGDIDGSRPGTIYVFDVEYPSPGVCPTVGGPQLVNRRVFACADSGGPDGIKLDIEGNIYAGCFDGVHVWNRYGTLIGKILFPRAEGDDFDGCANFCFIPGGRLVCMAEDKVYLVEGLTVEGALL